MSTLYYKNSLSLPLKPLATNLSSCPYILIHGAWHGSWCWGRVKSQLENLGHKVITPDLPGHYINKMPFKNINLQLYVRYLEDLILRNNYYKVILVGHSMGGVVVSQLAENIPQRIEKLIYTCAFIPDNHGSLIDEEKKSKLPTVALKIKVNDVNNSISLPLHSPDTIKDLFYGRCSEIDFKYALSLLQDQPFLPFIDRANLSNKFHDLPKLYIECLEDKAIMIDDQRRMYSKIKCDVVSLETDHSPFFSADEELSKILHNAYTNSQIK